MYSAIHSQSHTMTRRVQFLLSIVLLPVAIALVLLGYIGTFSRYMADDYCSSSILQTLGYIPAQLYWYQEWTGRFSFSFLVTSIELLGSAFVSVQPALMLLLFCIASAWTAYQLAYLVVGPHAPLYSISVGLVFVFSLFATTPNIVQSLYWQTGALTYVLPLIILTIMLGSHMCIYRTNTGFRTQSILVIVLAFFAAGLSDMYAVFQLFVLILATFLVWWHPHVRGRLITTLMPTLFVALLASIIVASAPGNAIRQNALPPRSELHIAIINTFYYAARTLLLSFVRAPLPSLAAFCVPALLSYELYRATSLPRVDRASIVRAMLALGIITILLILVCTFPAVYILSSSVPLRARIIPQYVTVVALFVSGTLLGIWMADYSRSGLLLINTKAITKRLVVCCVLLLIIGSACISIYQSLRIIPQARASVLQWERIDQQIRNQHHQGLSDIVIPKLDLEMSLGSSVSEFYLEVEPNNWKNICAARYYNVRSIRTLP